MMKLHDKVTDAQVREALRRLEVKGLIRSEIDGDGNLRFYAAESRGKLVKPHEGNVTTLSNAAESAGAGRNHDIGQSQGQLGE
jgi:hypothetical protein